MKTFKSIAALVILTGAWAASHAAVPARLSEAEARHLLVRTGFSPDFNELRSLTGKPAAAAVAALVSDAQAARPLHPPPDFVGQSPPIPPAIAEKQGRAAGPAPTADARRPGAQGLVDARDDRVARTAARAHDAVLAQPLCHLAAKGRAFAGDVAAEPVVAYAGARQLSRVCCMAWPKTRPCWFISTGPTAAKRRPMKILRVK